MGGGSNVLIPARSEAKGTEARVTKGEERSRKQEGRKDCMK